MNPEPIDPNDLEMRMLTFYDTKKHLVYLKTGGWAWCDRDEADSYGDWMERTFDTAWEAILDATAPYFEEGDR